MTRSAAAAAGLKFRGWPMIIQTLGLGEKSARLQKHWEALYMRIKERDVHDDTSGKGEREHSFNFTD